MDMTWLEQRAYIKIPILWWRNARECNSELVEGMGNNACPYRTLQGEPRCFRKDVTSILHNTWLTTKFLSPLFYNSRAHCPLLQYLCTTSAILAGTFLFCDISCSSRVTSILHDAWLTTEFVTLCYNSRAHCPLMQYLRTSKCHTIWHILILWYQLF